MFDQNLLSDNSKVDFPSQERVSSDQKCRRDLKFLLPVFKSGEVLKISPDSFFFVIVFQVIFKSAS